VDQPQSIGTLSFNKRRLVELMRELNYGRINQLYIKCGEPYFTPPPVVIKDIDLGKAKNIVQNVYCPQTEYFLKKQIIVLFDCMKIEGDGIVNTLIVQDGLPVRMKLEKPFRA